MRGLTLLWIIVSIFGLHLGACDESSAELLGRAAPKDAGTPSGEPAVIGPGGSSVDPAAFGNRNRDGGGRSDGNGITFMPPDASTGVAMCGSFFCGSSQFTSACCTSEEDVNRGWALNSEVCGQRLLPSFPDIPVGLGCFENDQPGVRDTNCPVLTIALQMAAGCCTEFGFCGNDASSLTLDVGLGCIMLDDGSSGDPPMRCGGDAGKLDAGK